MVSLPRVRVNDSEHPLDWLLDQVRQQRVAIEDVAMAPLVARFFEYVAGAADRNLSLDIEWLLMAATLIQWKSRSLLPDRPRDPDPIRDELVRQLAAHRQEAAADLARRRQQAGRWFSKPGIDPLAEPGAAADDDEPVLSVWDLLQEARELARWAAAYRLEEAERKRSAYPVPAEEVTLDQMIGVLTERMGAVSGKTDLTGLLFEQATPARRSTLFLAALELARRQEVRLEQEGLFAPILAERAQPGA
jgi:segregation and condensation protein A